METVKRASLTTSLALGLVEAPVKLFKTSGKEGKEPTFVTAGPNGKPLRAEKRAVETPVEETPDGDPLGLSEDEGADPTVVPPAKPAVTEDPGPESVPPLDESVGVPLAGGAESAPGTFKTVMIEEETGVEVEPDDVRRGIRLDDGRFADLTPLLDRIDEESKIERLQVLDFIRRERVPRERIVGSYYLAAGAKGYAPRVLRILYEAMRRTERVAIVRWTKSKGQSLGFLIPHGSGALVVLEVTFADAARKPNATCLAHMKASVTEKHVERAVELISSMNAPPSVLDNYVNRRTQLQRELVERATAGVLDEFEIVEERADEVDELDQLLVAATGS